MCQLYPQNHDTALVFAASKGHVECVRLLLLNRDTVDVSAIICVCVISVVLNRCIGVYKTSDKKCFLVTL